VAGGLVKVDVDDGKLTFVIEPPVKTAKLKKKGKSKKAEGAPTAAETVK
jgi:hypothetical protein